MTQGTSEKRAVIINSHINPSACTKFSENAHETLTVVKY